MISIIAAVAQNGAIGLKGDLIYHIPADMKRFKALTTGNTVVMGRKTFDSLPKGALPNRRNIVLSRNKELVIPGCDVFQSIEDVVKSCRAAEKLYIMGGAQLYAQTFDLADELEITLVHDTPTAADAFFPDFSDVETWQLVNREDHEPDEKTPFAYSFLTYRRK